MVVLDDSVGKLGKKLCKPHEKSKCAPKENGGPMFANSDPRLLGQANVAVRARENCSPPGEICYGENFPGKKFLTIENISENV